MPLGVRWPGRDVRGDRSGEGSRRVDGFRRGCRFGRIPTPALSADRPVDGRRSGARRSPCADRAGRGRDPGNLPPLSADPRDSWRGGRCGTPGLLRRAVQPDSGVAEVMGEGRSAGPGRAPGRGTGRPAGDRWTEPVDPTAWHRPDRRR